MFDDRVNVDPSSSEFMVFVPFVSWREQGDECRVMMTTVSVDEDYEERRDRNKE